jgi:hypothetical protein
MDIKENTGIMFNNKQWIEGSKQPRVRGEINVGGKIMEIAMWVKKSANGNTYYSLALKDSQPQQDKITAAKHTNSYPDMDDDIPFNL